MRWPVAHDLSGSVFRSASGLLGRSDAPVGSPRGGSCDQVQGCFGSLRGFGVHSVGSGGVARDRGADVSTLARPLRGRRRSRLVGPPAGEGVGQAGSGGSGAGSGSSVSERYSGFTAKHFHEQLLQRHDFRWSYSWTKTFLQSKGLLEKAKRRGAHRRRRPRRPLPGMMLHQDGSRHQWLVGQPALDLIVTMDDATSAILSAFLIEEEGTARRSGACAKCSSATACR